METSAPLVAPAISQTTQSQQLISLDQQITLFAYFEYDVAKMFKTTIKPVSKSVKPLAVKKVVKDIIN